jgi:hypothetical protein
MSDTLAQLITKLQALLLGDSTTFSTATCTAAIRQALLQLNMTVPAILEETVDAVTCQWEYELEDQTALAIIDVQLEGSDTYKEFNTSLKFHAFFQDDRPCFRLLSPAMDGDTLLVQYTAPYIINGLDDETESTLPAMADTVLIDGAAWIACLIRAAGRIEQINMNQDVPASFERMAAHFRQAFEMGLVNLARRQPKGQLNTSLSWSYDPRG